MNPLLKRALAIVAVKKAVDAFRNARRPQKPSLASRLAVPAALVAGAGAVAYLATTGRLQGVTDQVKQITGSGPAGADVPPAPPAPAQPGPVGPPA
jgi:hypothetical protein